MAEVKKLWVVRDVYSTIHDLESSARGDENAMLQEFYGEFDMLNILGQASLLGVRRCKQDNIKFYLDEASAKRDAAERLQELRDSDDYDPSRYDYRRQDSVTGR